MQTMKSKLIIVLGVLAAVYACQEEDLDQFDPNSVTPDRYFQLEEEIDAGLYAAYSVLQSQNLGSRLYYYLNDLRGGELMGTDALIGSLPRFVSGSSLATDGEVDGYWTALYRIVHYSNTTIAGIDRNELLPDSVLTPLRGEARFLRGWAYNELATHYGGVPLYDSVVASVNDAQPRATEAEAFDFAQADLAAAAEVLPLSRPEGDRGRATRGAALAFLGRSHMQENDLDAAKAALEQVVALGRYELNDDYGMLFTEENSFLSESIFEIVFAPFGDFDWGAAGDAADSKTVRAQEYGPVWHNVQPSAFIVGAYANEDCGDSYTDPRLRENIVFRGDTIANGGGVYAPNANGSTVSYCTGDVYPGVYKYGVMYKEVPPGYRTATTNLILIRYADVLLLLAEIEARQGNSDAAREYLNRVRSRVGVPPVEDTEFADDLVRAVQQERTVELAFEQVRFRDAKRWNDAGILPGELQIPGFEPNERVLPIPQREITNNPNISPGDQNPGFN